MIRQKAVFVVDMVKGFAYEGPLASPHIKSIIKPIEFFLSDYREKRRFFICDSHSETDLEMNQYPKHCLFGTSESQVVEELKPYMDGIIFKNTTNAFHHIPKAWYEKYEGFEIIGCCSDICIMQFALSLKTYLNSINSDKDVIVYENLIATFDSEDHNQEEFHNFAIKIMKNAGIKIRTYA